MHAAVAQPIVVRGNDYGSEFGIHGMSYRLNGTEFGGQPVRTAQEVSISVIESV